MATSFPVSRSVACGGEFSRRTIQSGASLCKPEVQSCIDHLVHLAEACSRNRFFADAAENLFKGATKISLHDGKRFVIWEGWDVILELA